jgi:hypothetical protein
MKRLEAEEIVNGDVDRFVATARGGALFFVNGDNKIYFQKDAGKPVYACEVGGTREFFIVRRKQV